MQECSWDINSLDKLFLKLILEKKKKKKLKKKKLIFCNKPSWKVLPQIVISIFMLIRNNLSYNNVFDYSGGIYTLKHHKNCLQNKNFGVLIEKRPFEHTLWLAEWERKEIATLGFSHCRRQTQHKIKHAQKNQTPIWIFPPHRKKAFFLRKKSKKSFLAGKFSKILKTK